MIPDDAMMPSCCWWNRAFAWRLASSWWCFTSALSDEVRRKKSFSTIFSVDLLRRSMIGFHVHNDNDALLSVVVLRCQFYVLACVNPPSGDNRMLFLPVFWIVHCTLSSGSSVLVLSDEKNEKYEKSKRVGIYRYIYDCSWWLLIARLRWYRCGVTEDFRDLPAFRCCCDAVCRSQAFDARCGANAMKIFGIFPRAMLSLSIVSDLTLQLNAPVSIIRALSQTLFDVLKEPFDGDSVRIQPYRWEWWAGFLHLSSSWLSMTQLCLRKILNDALCSSFLRWCWTRDDSAVCERIVCELAVPPGSTDRRHNGCWTQNIRLFTSLSSRQQWERTWDFCEYVNFLLEFRDEMRFTAIFRSGMMNGLSLATSGTRDVVNPFSPWMPNITFSPICRLGL